MVFIYGTANLSFVAVWAGGDVVHVAEVICYVWRGESKDFLLWGYFKEILIFNLVIWLKDIFVAQTKLIMRKLFLSISLFVSYIASSQCLSNDPDIYGH